MTRPRGLSSPRRRRDRFSLPRRYPLESAAAAVACALLTEAFGFSSGLIGYSRKGLVSWDVASEFATISVPVALLGAAAAPSLAANTQLLRAVYAVLMLSLSWKLAGGGGDAAASTDGAASTAARAGGAGGNDAGAASRDGTAATAGGAFLTGLLGGGIGEVVLPQLTRGRGMPIPSAAGTSVAVVTVTAAAAAVAQLAQLAAAADDAAGVVPWELVCYTVPGVIVGGQIAPRLAGRLDDATIERAAAVLFGFVGLAFAAKAAAG